MKLKRLIMSIIGFILVTNSLAGVVYAEAPTRDTRSWTDPHGSGRTITFSTPETYNSCTSTFDRLYTTGVPDNWSLSGYVNINYIRATEEVVRQYLINQKGNLDLSIAYPPVAEWPVIQPSTGLREIHVDLSIGIYDETGDRVPWVGGDPVRAPGTLGPGGQDWDVYCNLPPAPAITIQKLTNGEDANTPPGPTVMVGDPITWTYIVTNTGNVALTNVAVTDDQLGFICTIGALAVNASSTCTKNGVAVAGQYANTGTTTGEYGGSTVSDHDPSHYFGANPNILIKKLTNGEDANTPPGPTIRIGDPITWTYIVTNTGNVALTNVQVTDDIEGLICTIGALAVNASSTCTKSGVAAAGQYANTGTTTGVYSGTTVTDTDPSHYFGFTPGPAIDLKKLTNGEDANTPPGPTVTVGDPITWTYIVTNIGNVALTNVQVTDDIEGLICTIGALAASASSTCTKSGVAVAGQYANTGTTTGVYITTTVTDTDPSHYFGFTPGPAIDLKKLTNGQDANTPPGPTVRVGDPITWTYIVTNIGNVALTDVQVNDDKVGFICTIGSLAVSASSSCAKNGVAVAGQYANTGTTTGVYSGTTVTDTDPSHYFGGGPNIVIKKLTNGEDANTPPGPTVMVGDPITWTYIVTNTGNVALTGVQVTDDIEGLICTIGALAVNASSTCTKSGLAQAGQYANTGTTTGVYSGTTVTDTDPSHYFGGVTPGIVLKKFTNGQDANNPPGPTISVGSVVTWTYIVTNTGNVALTNVQVSDDKVGFICTVGALAVSASSTCTKNGIAVGGQYENMGTATGVYSGTTVTSTDPSHYFGPLLYRVWFPGVMASAPNFPPPVSLDLTIGYEDKKLGDPKMDFDYNDWVTNIHAQLSLNPDFLLTRLDLDILPRARGGDYLHAYHIDFPANTFTSNGTVTLVIKDQNGAPINTQTFPFTASQSNKYTIFSCTCDVYPQPAGVVNAIEGRPVLTAQRTATLSIEFTNPVVFDFAKLDYSYITPHGSGLFFSPHISVFAGGGYEVNAGDERMLVVPEATWQWPEENVWLYKAYTLVTHPRPFTFPANWYQTHNTCVFGDGVVCVDKGP